MSANRLQIAALALLAAAGTAAGAAAASAAAGTPRLRPTAIAQIAEIERWKGARTAAERKIDSRLLFALDRAARRLAPLLANIEALPLEEPGAGAERRLLLDVDLLAGAEPAALAPELRRLGGETISLSRRFAALRIRLPANAVRELAADPAVRRIVPARLAYTQHFETERGRAVEGGAGPVVSEGDRVHRADEARDLYALSGAGTKVCVLSNGIESLAYSQEGGELPAVDVLPGQEGGGDEGTAMLEIVHDLAPGAELGFATAFGGLGSFAQNVLDLAADGCRVIVDDVIYLNESPFQDSPVAAAADAVAAAGVLYLSSAGNEGNLADGTSGTWEGDFHGNGTVPALPGVELHDFGDGGVSNLVLDDSSAVVLNWTDPYGSAADDYDLYVLTGDLGIVLRFSNDTQDGVGGDDDPFEFISIVGSGAFKGDRIVVARVAGADRMLNVSAFRGEMEIATAGALRGHTAAVGTVAVAAAPAADGYVAGQPVGPYPAPYDAAQLSETFSADGPRRIYFDAAGALLPGAPAGDFSATGGVVRAKPDLTAADGVSTSVDGYTTFFGTSAAAPHAAAIAALAMEGAPSASAAEVRAALEGSALDIELPAVDIVTGHGIVLPIAALTALAVPLRANLELAGVSPVETFGNGDAVLDPGESFRLELALANVGGATALAVSGVVATSSPGVEIVDAGASWPSLAGGAGATPPASAPEIRILSSVACGAILEFTLTVDYGGGVAPQSFPFRLTLGAAGEPIPFSWSGPPVAIPDSPERGFPGPPAVATLAVGGLAGRLADLDFRFDGSLCSDDFHSTTVGVSHGFVSNLLFDLKSPSGTTLSVVRFADGFGNNFCQTLLDDESAGPWIQSVRTDDNPFTGSYTPARPLSRFDGEDGNGLWTLTVTDWNPLDTGYLRAFTLIAAPAVCRAAAATVEVPALSGLAAAFFALALAAVASSALARRARR